MIFFIILSRLFTSAQASKIKLKGERSISSLISGKEDNSFRQN
jgi:hypothetical protein